MILTFRFISNAFCRAKSMTCVCFNPIFGRLAILFLLLLSACSEEYVPKPKGYPRLVLPQHAYQSYADSSCPFTFDYPTYAKVEKDADFFGKKPENPCWLNLEFADINATIHLSYKPIGQKNTLAALIEDAHELNSKHVIKANAMTDSLISTPHGVHGLFYEIAGNTATSTQFFLTDSSRHFLWAALYFKSRPNEDSIAPVVRFVRKDMERLIETFRWR